MQSVVLNYSCYCDVRIELAYGIRNVCFRAGGTGVARVATATPIFWGSFIAATTAATPIFWGCVCCGHPKVLDRAPAL